MPPPTSNGAVFDPLARDYDRLFTNTLIGSLFRAAVWQRLDVRFRAGDRVLDMGCGTGADALYLAGRGVQVVAADISASMIRTTQEKVVRAGFASLVSLRQLAIEDLASSPLPELIHPFDGALFNFGSLNCVADLRKTAQALAQRLRPGAVALLCIMAPLCPWEWLWLLRRGQPRKAFRRLRFGGVQWRGITVRYPSARAVARAFTPQFQLLRTAGIGALTPPPFAESWAAARPNLTERLNAWERRLEAYPPLSHFCDHYLIELEKR
ncbi:MAG TPA: methyltransferase domain-containing protein [Armatimonadota bacterium]|nr:methyltransferase domain-containing protein [Armatimonadota bacterium]